MVIVFIAIVIKIEYILYWYFFIYIYLLTNLKYLYYFKVLTCMYLILKGMKGYIYYDILEFHWYQISMNLKYTIMV